MRAAFVLMLTATLASCGGASGSERGGRDRGGGPGNAAPALAVEFTTLMDADIDHHYRASGTLLALRRAEIRPVQTGVITTIEVEEGQSVEAGQRLARLDGRELSIMAKRDKIAAASAEAELDRLESIRNADAIAGEEIDRQRYELKSAKANARLSRHQAKLTSVVAPFAGTIVRRHVDMGNLATSTTVVFELADTSRLRLELHLPEREAAGVKSGAEVDMELLDGSSFAGTIIRRAPVVDPMTGTVKLTVEASEFPEAAVPGSFVRARILLDRRTGAASLPRSAIVDVDGAPQVYVHEEGKARRIVVELGLEGEERVEVVGGLAADQQVVADASGITDGMAIKAVGEPDEDAKSGASPKKSY